MKHEILKTMKDNVLVAVIRGTDEDQCYNITKKVIEGGIKTLEITFSTPYAENVIEKISKEYSSDKEILVGAGTVLDDITARIAIMKGAKFIVSPHLDLDIAKVCNRYMIPYLPGCGTITEVVKAIESGSDVVKLFPAGVLGSGFIKDAKGPLPFANIMPSGGVSLDNMHEWLEKGAYAIGIGSVLTKDIKTKGYESVADVAREFVKKLKK